MDEPYNFVVHPNHFKMGNEHIAFSVFLHRVALDSTLLSAHELRVYALPRISLAHCHRILLHIRAEAHEMADSFRVECTGACFDTLWNVDGIYERGF